MQDDDDAGLDLLEGGEEEAEDEAAIAAAGLRTSISRNGDGRGPRGINIPYFSGTDRPWSAFDVFSHVEYTMQRTANMNDLSRSFAPRKRLPTDRLITAGGFRRIVEIVPLHKDPDLRKLVPEEVLFLHLIVHKDDVIDGVDEILSPEAKEIYNPQHAEGAETTDAGGGVVVEETSAETAEPKEAKEDGEPVSEDGTFVVSPLDPDDPDFFNLPIDHVFIRRPMRWFTFDGMKPETASRGQTGRNLISKQEVLDYLRFFIAQEGLDVYGVDAYDSATDEVRWRTRQLFWDARNWALMGPPNSPDIPEGDENRPEHRNWHQGAFYYGHTNDRYREYIGQGRDAGKSWETLRLGTFAQFYQMVPSEYFARWQFFEVLARQCEDAVEGQSVQEAIDAYINLADMFSAVDRRPIVVKVRSKQDGKYYLFIHRGTAKTRYCSVYEADDDNKFITSTNQYLEQLQLMEEMSMPPGKPVAARGDWYGSALREQDARDLILQSMYYDATGNLPAQFLDPRFYLGQHLGEMAIQDRDMGGIRVHAGPHVFLQHSNLNLDLVDSARKLRDLGLSAAGGTLTTDFVDKRVGELMEWEDLVRVYKVGEGRDTRYHSGDDPDNPRQLVAMVHPTDEAIDIDPMWVLAVMGRGDSLFYRTWPQRMANGWWEMGFPRQLGIDTQTWDNYGLHRTLAREVWRTQPVEWVQRRLDRALDDLERNHKHDALRGVLEIIQGMPGSPDDRDDMEEMIQERRKRAAYWMFRRIAENHFIFGLRRNQQVLGWIAEGLFHRIGDPDETDRLLQKALYWVWAGAVYDGYQGRAEVKDGAGNGLVKWTKQDEQNFWMNRLVSRTTSFFSRFREKVPEDGATEAAKRNEIADWLEGLCGMPDYEPDDCNDQKGTTPIMAQRFLRQEPWDAIEHDLTTIHGLSAPQLMLAKAAYETSDDRSLDKAT